MIPLSSDHLDRWIPPSLANLPAPPVFTFQPATWNTRRRFTAACLEHNLVFHSEEQLEAEMDKALRNLWSPDIYERESARLKQALMDSRAGVLSDAEAASVDELIRRIMENWPRYNRMLRDNASFIEYAPWVSLSLLLVGWTGLKTPYRREAGEVPFETIEAMKREIMEIETEYAGESVDGVVTGLAFNELANEGLVRLNLSAAERKNSSSEPQYSGIPDGSTAPGPAPTENMTSGASNARKTKSKRSRATSST